MDEFEDGWRGERRARLLKAAGRVFAQQRYEDASMDAIAHEAGIGKPTVYRYFDSKEALFAAVFADALDDLERRLEMVLESEVGVARRLRGLLGEMVPTFRQHLVSLRFLSEVAAVADQSKRRVFRERRARIADFIVRAIGGGAASGEVRAVDPQQLAHFAIGMIWSGRASSPDRSDGEIADAIADILLHGVMVADTADAPAWTAGHLVSTHPTRHREALT